MLSGNALDASSVTQQQWRGLASGAGKGKGGKEGSGDHGGDGDGMFDRLKKTFAEEIEKVRSCLDARLLKHRGCPCSLVAVRLCVCSKSPLSL